MPRPRRSAAQNGQPAVRDNVQRTQQAQIKAVLRSIGPNAAGS